MGGACFGGARFGGACFAGAPFEGAFWRVLFGGETVFGTVGFRKWIWSSKRVEDLTIPRFPLLFPSPVASDLLMLTMTLLPMNMENNVIRSVTRAGNLQRAEWRGKCRQILADHLGRSSANRGKTWTNQLFRTYLGNHY